MAAKPFKLEQQLPIVRQTDGRFREVSASAPAPIPAPAKSTSSPVQWAPMVGQGTALDSDGEKHWPPVAHPKVTR
jgi:hypothetical protein